MLADLTATQIALMTLILLLAGMTKGVLGVGLPLVAVPLLSQVVSVPLAIMTLAVSTVVSNAFQAIQGRDALLVVKRFWTLLLPFVVTLFLAAHLLVVLNDNALGLIMGVIIIFFTLLNYVPKLSTVRVEHERYLNPVIGLLAGLLIGQKIQRRMPQAAFRKGITAILLLTGASLILRTIFGGAFG